MLKDLLINQLAPGEIDRTGERVDGKATIIGKLGYYWIAVLDAQYRMTNVKFYFNQGTIPPSMSSTTIYQYSISISYSQAQILSEVGQDLKSSEVNTLALLSDNLANVARVCNSESLLGRPCSVPNIQTAAFICTKADLIDNADPTASTYPEKQISKQRIWTSSSNQINVQNAAQVYTVNLSTRIIYETSVTQAYTAVPILEIPAYEDRTGERIDNKATIIGRLGENWIAVLDAAYRGTAQYSTKSNMDITKGLPYTSSNYTVTATSTENYILAQILYDIHSSKWNTCYLNQVQPATSFPAAKMCYDINVGGNHAQLPNAQALAFVYSKKDYIDAKDPTASTNPDYKLSNWGFGSSFGYLAASTNGVGAAYCVAMNASGLLHSSFTSYRTGVYGVCPILEIPLYKDRTGERVDGKATIVGKLDRYWIAALDSIYRSQYVWSTEGSTYGQNYLSGAVTNFILNCDEVVFLNKNFLKDGRTSAYATNMKGTNPAFKACLDTKLLGKDCALPTVQTMAFLRSWGTFVDSIDPTVINSGIDIALGRAISYWTSSFPVGTSDRAYKSDLNGSELQLKSATLSVCPILEIPLWCDDDYK